MALVYTVIVLTSFSVDLGSIGFLIYCIRQPSRIFQRPTFFAALLGLITAISAAGFLLLTRLPLAAWVIPFNALALGLVLVFLSLLLRQALKFRPPSTQRAERLTEKLQDEIAERRQIERELAHLASFPELDPNCAFEIDSEGVIGYVNPSTEERFPDLRSLGKHHPTLEGLDVVLDVLQRDHKTLLKRPIKVGARIYDQQVSLPADSRRIRVYMVDITELKKLEQLKNDFVNMVSHELRTPLTAIQAAVRMVSDGILGPTLPDQKDALAMALNNIGRLGRIINDLLDISKIEAGKFEIHPDHVDLKELLQEVGKSFQLLFQERGLSLRLDLPDNPVDMLVDRDKMTQILTNLLNNAAKFTPQGTITLSLALSQNEVVCTVADTGRGIAPSDLPKVFEKFQQLGAPIGEKGTGLGLSICKGLVELHHGKIWAESTLGQGTRFIFSLPRREVRELFLEYVGKIYEQAVACGKPFSLLRLDIEQWAALQKTVPSGLKAAVFLQELEALIRTGLRSDFDMVFKMPDMMVVVLPGVDKEDAQQIAGRIEQGFHDFRFQQAIETPLQMTTLLVAYPADGQLLEQLLGNLCTPPASTFHPNSQAA